MADSLPSPPITRESTPFDPPHTTITKDLVQALDDLLEEYLESLDEYTKLREELTKSFSQGFISLAHAQRASTLGPGRRYGQDGYDGRMKASRRVSIEKGQTQDDSNLLHRNLQSLGQTTPDIGQGSTYDIRINAVAPKAKAVDADEQQEQEKRSRRRSLHEALETPESDPATVQEPAPRKCKVNPAYRDPITWFGFFVPLPLRQAQQAFSSSVDGTIPKLIGIIGRMESLEKQITALREELSSTNQEVEADVSVRLQGSKI